LLIGRLDGAVVGIHLNTQNRIVVIHFQKFFPAFWKPWLQQPVFYLEPWKTPRYKEKRKITAQGFSNMQPFMLQHGQAKQPMTNPSIQTYLVQRAKANDRQAQNELYKLYAGAMYNICRRMMGNEEDAKDVLQDAFIDAFSHLKNLKDEHLFSAWIKRIVVNHNLNALKKKRIDVTPLKENFDAIEDDGDDRDLTYEVKRVMKAIDQISDGCKVVLNLYLFEGYDHQEIAEILSITESTSKAQYSKAKKKLREILAYP
jgi:RNA polymerase sigma-70 factor (ECF subfamily)